MLLAYKKISLKEFTRWRDEYQKLKNQQDTGGLEKHQEKMETGLSLLGCIALRD